MGVACYIGYEAGTGMFYTIGGIDCAGFCGVFVMEACGAPIVSTFFMVVTILSDEGLHSSFSKGAMFQSSEDTPDCARPFAGVDSAGSVFYSAGSVFYSADFPAAVTGSVLVSTGFSALGASAGLSSTFN